MSDYGSLMTGEWNYINTLVAPPASGQVRLNNAVLKSATVIWVHKLTANGSIDSSNFLMAVKPKQEIYLQDRDDSTKWNAYGVTANPVHQGTYVQYQVIWARGSNTLSQQRIIVSVLAGAYNPTTDPVSAYAFPSNTPAGNNLGITTRQHYASQALIGFLSNGGPIANLIGGKGIEYCFQVADNMIAFEREQKAGAVPVSPGGQKIIS